MRALRAVAAEHGRVPLELVTMPPEAARGVPDQIRGEDAAFWLLAPWVTEAEGADDAKGLDRDAAGAGGGRRRPAVRAREACGGRSPRDAQRCIR